MLQGVILGSGASKPSQDRNPSAIFVRAEGLRILLDCGQGTQRHLLKYAPEFFMDVVVISHHHTDHDHGLRPYLESMSLLERTEELIIYTPEPHKIHHMLKQSKIRYPVVVRAATVGVQFVHKKCVLQFERAQHTLTCVGVRIESLERTRYDRKKLLKLSEDQRKRIFMGGEADLAQYRLQDCPRYSLYYSGDTVWIPQVSSRCHPLGLMIHQCTYMRPQDRALARQRGHTHLEEISIPGAFILTHLGERVTHAALLKNYALHQGGTWAHDGLKFANRIW